LAALNGRIRGAAASISSSCEELESGPAHAIVGISQTTVSETQAGDF
jgi:hypothetical protein